MFIRNRYNKDGNIIDNPNEYVGYSIEFRELLNEIYCAEKENFDQNN